MNFPRDRKNEEKEKKINVTSCGGKATTIVYKDQSTQIQQFRKSIYLD